MAFVIVNQKPYDSRPAGAWFVARSGSAGSYTQRLRNAETFSTHAEAETVKAAIEAALTMDEERDEDRAAIKIVSVFAGHLIDMAP